MRINTKLISLFLIIAVIPMMILGVLMFSTAQAVITEETLEELNLIATMQKHGIENLVHLDPDISDAELVAMVSGGAELGETGELSIAKANERGDAVLLSQRRFETEAIFSSVIPAEMTNLPIIQAINKKEGVLTGLTDYRGEPVLAATRYIEDAGLGIVVKIDEKEAFSAINKLRTTSLFIGGIILIIVLFVGLFMSKTISKPIKKLTANIEDISKGKLETQIDPKLKESKDELGELARAFDRTLVSLKLAVKKVGLTKGELGLGEAIEAKEKAEKEAEEAKEDVELFRNLMQESNDGIFIIDPKTGGLIDVNKKACTALGYEREELLKMKVPDFQTTIPTIAAWKKHVEIVKKKGTRTFIGKHKRKDGKIIPGEVNVKYIKADSKEYFVAIIRYQNK